MTIEEKTIGIIQNCCAFKDCSITPESKIQDLSVDSLSFVEIIVMLETEFNITFDDEQLNINDYVYVVDIIMAVEVLLNAKKSF